MTAATFHRDVGYLGTLLNAASTGLTAAGIGSGNVVTLIAQFVAHLTGHYMAQPTAPTASIAKVAIPAKAS